ncbi:hypothetical protein L3X38_031251 [Prunus dulcis]|uniref:Uncharacterized protein n=1 Tax=Prunus dulcis TaxID=3755 RepID=A0AAD4YUT1_PRUDU|nr:hypothetical protein L3X38_031251 [Prunus dulcis]
MNGRLGDQVRDPFLSPESKAMALASASPAPKEKKNTSFPPRRGLIKLQIFEKLVKVVLNKASKPGAQGENRGEDGGESSTSQTPPSSAYSSDAN